MTLQITCNFDVSARFLNRTKKLNSKINRAALLATNDTLRFGRAKAKREILRQVNFSAGYLDGRGSSVPRLRTVLARPGAEPRGKIIGRRESTSLARFDAKTTKGAKGVSLKVKARGGRTRMPRAFLTKLRNGNQGFALRVPNGELPSRKFRAKPLYQGLTTSVYLLYGPSVNQIFDDVAEDIRPELNVKLEQEFFRQASRLNVGF